MAESKKDLLCYKKTNFYEVATPEQIDAAYEYAKNYMKYLDASKTEREAVSTSIAMAEEQGYVPYTFGMDMQEIGRAHV